MDRISTIGPKRRAVQWFLALLWLGIPFVRIDGHGLVEFNLPGLTLYLGGLPFRIEEMYLLWLLVLTGIFLFLFITMALGRVWCGWACPQTAFTDLVEGFARMIGMKAEKNRFIGNSFQRGILHLFYLIIGLAAGYSFVWYFVPPYEFFDRLAAGNLGPWPLGTGLVLAFIVLIDLVFLRRLFCREFCPYGRFQTIIAHADTLTIRALPSELDRCIECQACVRACPMGIDIREGFQIECINCARCIDACRKVMAPKRQKGIIAYTFGTENRGWRGLFNPRLILIGIIFLILATVLFYNATHRHSLSFKIGRSPAIPARLQKEDKNLTFFTGHLRNLSEESRSLQIKASDSAGRILELKGPTKVDLDKGEKKSVRFGVVSVNPAFDETIEITISVYENDKKVGESPAYITHVEE